MAIKLDHYSVAEVSETRFHELTWLVQRSQNSLRKNAHRDEPNIFRVTDNLEDDSFGSPWLVEGARKHRAKSRALVGLTWLGSIWVKPHRNVQEMERTLLHEISHCFVRSQSHGPAFRRIYCVAIAHWLRQMGEDEAKIKAAIFSIVRRYRHYRQWTPQGRINSAQDYYGKVDAEVDKLYKASLKG